MESYLRTVFGLICLGVSAWLFATGPAGQGDAWIQVGFPVVAITALFGRARSRRFRRPPGDQSQAAPPVRARRGAARREQAG